MLFFLMFILAASPIVCNSCNTLPTVTQNGTPVVSSSPVSTPVAPQLNVWQQAGSGIELRYEHWKSPGPDQDTVIILRFDLQKVKLKVGYQPSQPMGISDWLQQEHARAVINGGYFDDQHKTTALVVAEGQAYGTSYNGFGGMLSVDSQGTVQLRSLNKQPYDPNNDQLQQATQSSPMFIINGQRTQFNANAAAQARSVVATDNQGHLLFIVAPDDGTDSSTGFALDEIADLLVASDLSLNNALNLDGGASTGMYMRSGNQQVSIDSIAALPIVIAIQ